MRRPNFGSVFLLSSSILLSAVATASADESDLHLQLLPRRKLVSALSDTSKNGLLCFASATTCGATTACEEDQCLQDTLGCAGSTFGSYTCPIFGYAVTDTAAFCFDTAAHAANFTACPASLVQSDSTFTGVCKDAAPDPTIPGDESCYIYYCPLGLPQAPPTPPAPSACGTSGRRMLLDFETEVDDAPSISFFELVRRSLASKARTPTSSSYRAPTSTPSTSSTYRAPVTTPAATTAYRAPVYSYRPAVYTTTSVRYSASYTSVAVLPVAVWTAVILSQRNYYINPYYHRSSYYYRDAAYANANPCKKSRVRVIAPAVIVPIVALCICLCCLYARQQQMYTTTTMVVEPQMMQPVGYYPQGMGYAGEYGIPMQSMQPMQPMQGQVYGTPMPPQTAPSGPKTVHLPYPQTDWEAVRPADGRVPQIARSPEGDTPPSHMTFLNMQPVPVTMFWLDPQGQEQRFDTVMPGGSHSFNTFVGHCWAARAPDGALVAVYRTKFSPTHQVQIAF